MTEVLFLQFRRCGMWQDEVLVVIQLISNNFVALGVQYNCKESTFFRMCCFDNLIFTSE